jgi:hypothetical protein
MCTCVVSLCLGRETGVVPVVSSDVLVWHQQGARRRVNVVVALLERVLASLSVNTGHEDHELVEGIRMGVAEHQAFRLFQ